MTSDGPTSRRMLELAQKSVDKNLKVGVGLMSRHSRHLEQLSDRIQDGQLGDITGMRAYRMSGSHRLRVFGTMPRRRERIAVADSTFPQFPVGQRWSVQRLLHSRHRSLQLDEERLADQGSGLGRTSITARSPNGNLYVDQKLRFLRR